MGIDHSVITYRNPRKTDWESYRIDLSGCMSRMTGKINNFTDIELAANQLQDAITSSFNENCPLTVRENNKNTYWWNHDITAKRREVRRLFNVAKKSGNWTDYKTILTYCNKALRQSKRESLRRHFEETEKTPDLPDSEGFFQRMGRVKSVNSSLKMEYTPQKKKEPWKSYFGSNSLDQK